MNESMIEKLESFRHELLVTHVKLEQMSEDFMREKTSICSKIMALRAILLSVINEENKTQSVLEGD